MLKEVIVVEGSHDAAAVKRAVEAEVIITHGFSLPEETLQRIRLAQERRGVIVFTDPDGAGERIRTRISKAVPGCRHAFLSRDDAEAKGDIGIENASPEAIRNALDRARVQNMRESAIFSMEDLLEHGLVGNPDSARLRARLGEILGVGYTNAKQFLHRLNNYGISREEFMEGIAVLKKESKQ